MLKYQYLAAAVAALALTACGSAPTSYSEPRYVSGPSSRDAAYADSGRVVAIDVVRGSGGSSGAGAVIGGVLGGVLGHQVGNGRGNDAATAAGAVIGGLVGNQVDRNNGGVRPGERVTEVERVPVERNVERCKVIEETREATVGYDVRYDYLGRHFTTRMPRDPGRFVRINVEIHPVETFDEPPRSGPRSPSYQ